MFTKMPIKPLFCDGIWIIFFFTWSSLVAQTVKNPPAMQETSVQSQISWGREWLPTPVFWPEEFHGQRSLVGYIQSIGSQRVGHDWATFPFTLSSLSVLFKMFTISMYQFHEAILFKDISWSKLTLAKSPQMCPPHPESRSRRSFRRVGELGTLSWVIQGISIFSWALRQEKWLHLWSQGKIKL